MGSNSTVVRIFSRETWWLVGKAVLDENKTRPIHIRERKV
jgi:hypothetical protein